MRRAIAAAVLLLASTALARPARKPRPTPTPRPAATAAPYSGGRPTRAQLEVARNLVRPLLPWDDCLRQVVRHAGKPSLVRGDIAYWYAKDGNKCVELTMENMAGNVGVV